MTITQLEYIVAVDTHRSFARAAKHCYVTQPTLSMQVKKIEEELNVLLFDRSKKPVVTTEMGSQVIEQARVILQEAGRISEIIQNEKDEIKGELHIGIIPTLSPYLLPLFVTKFIEKYPEVTVVVEEIFTNEIIKKLKDDRLDVGILVTPLNEKSIVELPVFYEKFLIYMSTSHPLFTKEQINLQELDINEMWLLQEGHCFRSQTMNICGEKIRQEKNRLRFESGSLETLKRIVEKQFGYTFLPELATVDMEGKSLKYLKSFQKPEPLREVSLVTHRSFIKKRLIHLLMEEIQAHIPAELLNKERGKIIKIVN